MINHQGALDNLISTINSTNSDIKSMNTKEKDRCIYSVFIRLTAKNRVQLSNIIKKSVLCLMF